MRITIVAPAKVNLWLRVGLAGPSGFHDLDTLFCALDLADDVVLRAGEPGRGVRLGVRHGPPLDEAPDLGPVQDNLAVRAARAFRDHAGAPDNVRIALLKRIPPGGGLGGGSSDAAAVLRGLRRMHPGLASGDDLKTLGAALGSDVPFFLTGAPLARGTGRGDDVTPLPALPPRPVLLVLPPFPVATAEAYRWLDESRAGKKRRRRGAAPGGSGLPAAPGEAAPVELQWEGVEALARNDFEDVVFARHAVLGRIRDALLEAGAAIALLAGSGSALFGVFPDRETARDAAETLRRDDPTVKVVVTATRSR